MPESFVSGLSTQARHKVIELLNENLADTVALTLAVKQAHWTVKGRGFIGFHELLDEVADRLREGADLMAERITILGGYPQGTVEAAAEKSRLEPYPTDLEPIESHIEALKERFMAVGEKLRKAIEASEDAGDVDTGDLFTEVSRQIDKDAWFIGAHADAT
ncbi:DNA starvation/stationary phase protection protein Dps [Pelagovum pacificum]|uniref:DNA starvation/stationary phase protection protein Dps n=1 Tax=Pelagovum pacificum TaxID=2588711 RepID=A0A5C5GI04_9RHOB|nr:DNA starvation/stationary phase protection protein Dps [Pelagovum pacificum]QQA43100.1 DNA starvation/stationary phase protection protein Dps [Pelagovum pacificum]TNY33757.1 DNA starvation/stationary phase protection protein Dps [Pelagovum pacificum]